MPGIPFDWNIVIAGAWNLAILTPDFLRARLYNAPEGTPIELQVPLNIMGALRTKYNGLTIEPSVGRIIIMPDQQDREGMERAAEVAIRAIESLPVTPFSAAGLNFRYRFEETPDNLINYLESSIDDRLADAGHQITLRTARRSFEWRGGVLNLEMEGTQNTRGKIQFNFHRDSTLLDDLTRWVRYAGEMSAQTVDLTGGVLELPMQTNTEG